MGLICLSSIGLSQASSSGGVAANQRQGNPAAQWGLKNSDIIRLAHMHEGDAAIIRMIARNKTNFDTSAEALAALKKEGVSDRVISVMLNPETANAALTAPSLRFGAGASGPNSSGFAQQPTRAGAHSPRPGTQLKSATNLPPSEQRFCNAGSNWSRAEDSYQLQPRDPNPIRSAHPAPPPDPVPFERDALNALGPDMTFTEWQGLLSFGVGQNNSVVIVFSPSSCGAVAFQNRTNRMGRSDPGDTIISPGSAVYNVLSRAPRGNSLQAIVSGRLFPFPPSRNNNWPFQSVLLSSMGVTIAGTGSRFLARFDAIKLLP